MKRRAFTLVELVLSLMIMSILLGAMVSIIMISIRAIDSGKGPQVQAVAASDVMQELAQDVALATGFNQRTAAGVTPVVLDFTVPDRNNDGASETIRYEWSGVPGAALTRTYNGGTAVSVAKDVRELSLSYLTRFRKGALPPAPPPPQESGSVTHATFNPGGTSTVDFSSVNQYAEYFKPKLPTNTISWKVTRVEISIARRTASSTGNVIMQIKAADAAKKPFGAVIGSSSVAVTTIPTTLTVVSFPFTNVSSLNPSEGICFSIAGSSSTANGKALNKGAIDSGIDIQYTTSTNSGGSWATPTSTKALSFTVYGTYTTQGPPTW